MTKTFPKLIMMTAVLSAGLPPDPATMVQHRATHLTGIVHWIDHGRDYRHSE
ncbi:MAG: hypothetical protein ABSH50_04530 [Bryobacteraceae bacterium]